MATPLDLLPDTSDLSADTAFGQLPDQRFTPNKSPIAEGIEQNYGNEFTKGFRRGALGMLGTGIAAVGQAVEPFSAKKAQEMFEGAKQILDFAPGLRPRVENWDQVKDAGTFVDYGLSKMGEGAPSTLASFAGAGVGGAAGLGLRALGVRGATAGLGATAGGTAAVLAPEAGEAAMNLQGDPVAMANTTPWERAAIAGGKGIVNAALENLPERLAIGRAFQRPVSKAGMRSVLGSTAAGAGEAITGEALTEGAQEYAGQFAQSLANPNAAHDPNAIREAMLGGAFGGVGFGAAGGAIHGIRSRGADAVDAVKEKLPEVTAPSMADIVTDIRQMVQNPEYAGQRAREGADWAIEKGKEGLITIGELAAQAGDKAEAVVSRANQVVKDAIIHAESLDKPGETVNRKWLYDIQNNIQNLSADAYETLRDFVADPTNRHAREKIGYFARGMAVDTLPAAARSAGTAINDFTKGFFGKSVVKGARASNQMTDARKLELFQLTEHPEFGKTLRAYPPEERAALYLALNTIREDRGSYENRKQLPQEMRDLLTLALGGPDNVKNMIGFLDALGGKREVAPVPINDQTIAPDTKRKVGRGWRTPEPTYKNTGLSVNEDGDPVDQNGKVIKDALLPPAQILGQDVLSSGTSVAGANTAVTQEDEQGIKGVDAAELGQNRNEGTLRELQPDTDVPITHDVVQKSLQNFHFYKSYDPKIDKAKPHLMLRLRSDTATPEEILKSFQVADRGYGGKPVSRAMSDEEIAKHLKTDENGNQYAELPIRPMSLANELGKDQYRESMPWPRKGQALDSDQRKGDLFMAAIATLMNQGFEYTDANGVTHKIEVEPESTINPKEKIKRLPSNLAIGKMNQRGKGGEYTLRQYQSAGEVWTPRTTDQIEANIAYAKEFQETVGDTDSNGFEQAIKDAFGKIYSVRHKAFNDMQRIAEAGDGVNDNDPPEVKQQKQRAYLTARRNSTRAYEEINMRWHAIRALRGAKKHLADKYFSKTKAQEKYEPGFDEEQAQIEANEQAAAEAVQTLIDQSTRSLVMDGMVTIFQHLQNMISDRLEVSAKLTQTVEELQDYLNNSGNDPSSLVRKLFSDLDIPLFTPDLLRMPQMRNDKGITPQSWLQDKLGELYVRAKDNELQGIVDQGTSNQETNKDAYQADVPGGAGNKLWNPNDVKNALQEPVTQEVKDAILKNFTFLQELIAEYGKFRIQSPAAKGKSPKKLGFFQDAAAAQAFLDSLPLEGIQGLRIKLEGVSELLSYEQAVQRFGDKDINRTDMQSSNTKGASIVNPNTGKVLSLAHWAAERMPPEYAVDVLTQLRTVLPNKYEAKIIDATPMRTTLSPQPYEGQYAATQSQSEFKSPEARAARADQTEGITVPLTYDWLDKNIKVQEPRIYNEGEKAVGESGGTKPVEAAIRSEKGDELAAEAAKREVVKPRSVVRGKQAPLMDTGVARSILGEQGAEDYLGIKKDKKPEVGPKHTYTIDDYGNLIETTPTLSPPNKTDPNAVQGKGISQTEDVTNKPDDALLENVGGARSPEDDAPFMLDHEKPKLRLRGKQNKESTTTEEDVPGESPLEKAVRTDDFKLTHINDQKFPGKPKRVRATKDHGEIARKKFLQEIRLLGGVTMKEARDIIGESGFRANSVGSIFRKNGKELDLVAERLHDLGYISTEDYESVDGGVQVVRDLIRSALNGEVVAPLDQIGELKAAAAEASAMAAEEQRAKDKASADAEEERAKERGMDPKLWGRADRYERHAIRMEAQKRAQEAFDAAPEETRKGLRVLGPILVFKGKIYGTEYAPSHGEIARKLKAEGLFVSGVDRPWKDSDRLFLLSDATIANERQAKKLLAESPLEGATGAVSANLILDPKSLLGEKVVQQRIDAVKAILARHVSSPNSFAAMAGEQTSAQDLQQMYQELVDEVFERIKNGTDEEKRTAPAIYVAGVDMLMKYLQADTDMTQYVNALKAHKPTIVREFFNAAMHLLVPLTDERIAAVEADMRKQLGNAMDIYIAPVLMNERDEPQKGLGGVHGANKVTGFEQIRLSSMSALALSTDNEVALRKVAHHEVFHGIMSRIIDQYGVDAAKEVVNAAQAQHIMDQVLADPELSDKQKEYLRANPEEMLVQAYAMWAVGQLKLNPSSKLNKFFQAVKEMVQALFNSLSGDDLLYNVFEAAMRGELAAVGPLTYDQAKTAAVAKRTAGFITYGLASITPPAPNAPKVAPPPAPTLTPEIMRQKLQLDADNFAKGRPKFVMNTAAHGSNYSKLTNGLTDAEKLALLGNKEVTLVREPNNKHDPNAIAIQVKDSKGNLVHHGYISRAHAEKMAPQMDNGKYTYDAKLDRTGKYLIVAANKVATTAPATTPTPAPAPKKSELYDPAVKPIRFVSKWAGDKAGLKDNADWISNHARSPIKITLKDGRVLQADTVEAMYFALQLKDPTLQAAYAKKFPGVAKKDFRKLREVMPQAIKIMSNEGKQELMLRLTRMKYEQNPDLAQKLVATGKAQLLHYAQFGENADRYWGVDDKDVGRNLQGEIVMQVRSELQANAAPNAAAQPVENKPTTPTAAAPQPNAARSKNQEVIDKANQPTVRNGQGSMAHPRPIGMYYAINKGNLRADLNAKYPEGTTTAQLIKDGLRTGTTRPYPMGLRKGDIIAFPEVGDQKFRVTGFELVDFDTAEGRARWEAREGWSVEGVQRQYPGQVKTGAIQFTFEPVTESTPAPTKPLRSATRTPNSSARNPAPPSPSAPQQAELPLAPPPQAATPAQQQQAQTQATQLPPSVPKKLTDLIFKMFGKKVEIVIGDPPKGKIARQAAGKAWYVGRTQLDKYNANMAEIKQVREDRREALRVGDTGLAESLKAREEELLEQTQVVGMIYLSANLSEAEQTPALYHEALHAAFDVLLSPEERAALATAFSHGVLKNRLKQIFKDDPAVLGQIEQSSEEAAAYGFQIYAAAPEMLQIGERTKGIFNKIKEFLRKVMGVMTPEEKAAIIMNAVLNGTRNEKEESPLQKKLDKDMGIKDRAIKMSREVAKLVTQGFNVVAGSTYERMLNTENPAIIEIAKLGYTKTGEGGNVGMVHKWMNAQTEWVNRLDKAMKKYDVKVLKAAADAKQLGKVPTDPEALAAYNEMTKFFSAMHQYVTKAGTKIGFQADYYPMVWDAEKVLKEKNKFLAMVRKPEYAEEMEKLKVTPNELWENISGYITRGESFQGVVNERTGEPINEYAQERSLTFLSREDRHQFMQEDPIHTLLHYTKQMVRQAEYVRAYGVRGAKLVDLKREAVNTYGATKDQIALVDDYVDGLLGNKEIGMSRELKDLYGAMVVYQNFRLLPFNLFSSLVDPLGIAIRSNDIGDALETFGYSVKNIFRDLKDRKDTDKDQWEKLAEDWGIIEDAGVLTNLHHMYESVELRGFSKRMNEALFKYNLLNGWTRNTKIMAVKAAQRFFYRASTDSFGAEQSARYLQELGLSKSDIIADANGKLALTKDAMIAQGVSPDQAGKIERKLIDATTKFVNQSILNPTSADLPNWGSNPYFAPVFHLKQFMFTFQSTILHRIEHEAENGNYKPMWLSTIFIPGMIAADLMRGFVSNFGDEPPWQKNWGASDYLLHGVDRSGLLGVGGLLTGMKDDMMHGGQGYETLSGPSVEQLKKGVMALQGGDAKLWNFTVKSMPLNPIYDQWLLSSDGAAPKSGV
jgi:predicted NAD-dependent protein-ADP-ribosyltransferase YbiA (DUF1768 family)